MSMRFYLNSVSSANRVNVLVDGKITTTFDTTLDSGLFVLEANNQQEPIKPMTLFLITDDNNNVLDTYYIVLDKVELFSNTPLLYQHAITISQNTRKLSKHIVRNSVFTQPINEAKKGYYAINNEWNGYYFKTPDNLNNIENSWNETIVIRDTDKINGNLSFKVSIYGMYETNSRPLLYKITNISDLGSVSISTYYDLVDTTIYTSESQFPSASLNAGKSVVLYYASQYNVYTATQTTPATYYTLYTLDIDTTIPSSAPHASAGKYRVFKIDNVYKLYQSDGESWNLVSHTLTTNDYFKSISNYYRWGGTDFVLLTATWEMQQGGAIGKVYKYNNHYYKFIHINSNDYGFIFYEETPIQIELIKDETRTGVIITITENMLNKDLTNTTVSRYIKNNGAGTYYLKLVNTGNIFLTDLTSTSTKYNNSFDFVLRIEYSIPTYNYNAYDLLNLLLTRQRTILQSLDKGNQPLFTLPSSGDFYNLLINTIPPNFTFTGETFFDCVSDVFKLWDATFTIDNNGVLGIEYLNEYGDDITQSAQFTGFTSSHNEDKYNQALINFYQDALSKEIFPSKNGYCSPRSDGLGVPTSTNDFCILLPHKIHTLNSAKCYHPSFNIRYMVGTTAKYGDVVYDTNVVAPIEGLDISYFILEANLYGILNGKSDASSSTQGNMYRKQANCLYYAKGTNKIELGLTYTSGELSQKGYNFNTVVKGSLQRFFGLRFTPNDSYDPIYITSVSYDKYTDIKVNVDYTATSDGSLKVEGITNKYDGDMIVSQVNGSVDLNKLGLNMYGLSLKLGEPTLTMTHEIKSWADRIRKGQYIVKNGEKWVANICDYTFINDNLIQGTIDFTKNFNALSSYVKVKKEKRLSTIDNNLTVKSEILYNEYVYLSSTAFTQGKDLICMGNTALFDLTAKTFGFSQYNYNVDIALISTYKENGNVYYYTDEQGASKDTLNSYIPLIKYGAGNTLCFEMSMDNPKNAGNKTICNTTSHWFWTDKAYFTTIVPYTDDNGYADLVSAQLWCLSNQDAYNTDFPKVSVVGTQLAELYKMKVYKQPNETYALNYGLVMLPLESRKDIDFIGSEFIKNHGAVINEPNKHRFYVVYFTREVEQRYNLLDTKALTGAYRQKTDVAYITYNTTNGYLEFGLGGLMSNTLYKWAIVDEEDNIYFATNGSVNTLINPLRIYLLTKRTRIIE